MENPDDHIHFDMTFPDSCTIPFKMYYPNIGKDLQAIKRIREDTEKTTGTKQQASLIITDKGKGVVLEAFQSAKNCDKTAYLRSIAKPCDCDK